MLMNVYLLNACIFRHPYNFKFSGSKSVTSQVSVIIPCVLEQQSCRTIAQQERALCITVMMTFRSHLPR